MQPTKKSVHLISFPKSGRTWLKYMLGYAIVQHYHLSDRVKPQAIFQLSNIAKFAQKGQTIPYFTISHEKDHVETNPNYEHWRLPGMTSWHVIFIIRDPRDVVVSDYFEKAYRNAGCRYAVALKLNPTGKRTFCPSASSVISTSKIRDEKEALINELKPESDTCSCFPESFTLREFVRHPRGGFRTILEYDNQFYNRISKTARSYVLVRYEDLRKNTKDELKRLFKFLGIFDVSEEVLNVTIEASSFEKMRELELAGEMGKKLSPVDSNNINTYKTREGLIGNYVNYFSTEDVQWLNETMQAILNPVFGYK